MRIIIMIFHVILTDSYLILRAEFHLLWEFFFGPGSIIAYQLIYDQVSFVISSFSLLLVLEVGLER